MVAGAVRPDDGRPDNGLAARAAMRLIGFAALLRDNGFAVGMAESRNALRLLASPAAARANVFRAALRAILSSRHSEWQRFDALFDAYWLRRDLRRVQP